MKKQTVSLLWLVRLRWLAVAGQAATWAIVSLALHLALPTAPLLTLIGLGAATNLILEFLLARGLRSSATLEGGILILDTLLLAGLLAVTGGPANPFSILFLVHVALASVMLERPWSFILAALSVVVFGALFFFHRPLPGMGGHHDDPFSLHLQGMWIAFAIAAALLAYLVSGLYSALKKREEELAQSHRLVSLATLAAGAAHELSTPLGTIAVAAKELCDDESDPHRREDLTLIRSQVDRCRKIIEQMAAPDAASADIITLGSYFDHLLSLLDPRDRPRVTFANLSGVACVRTSRSALDKVLLNLLRNALASSSSPAPSHPVRFSISRSGNDLTLEVADQGEGMTETVCERAFEPFFTTKDPGAGMGLGLFLSRLLSEQMGAKLSLSSRQGEGTRAVVSFRLDQVGAS